ncbi:alpha/beta hydrolase [Actinotalea sp. M2MS4P-6]|uniref:alpha/beta hydrolase n=1 Tax=Actinotalea sp. M2MS4P-6 TaxID=2983762 RepID=UPI0021E44397|nr:alpha/beta hydrolase [Actinotalea sp. M2MS4P-6]MCV2396169.1 alpha/beta hydrolase [Actinotalea sp. M2MS4P-6]
MSLLTTRWVADTLTALMGRGPGPRIPAELAFAEIPASTVEMTVPTRHGDLDATVYRPAGGSQGAPVYLNFHGGGFVVRHREQDDPLCRFIAAEAGAVVVNVDYDTAPRHRFPVAVEEGFDAAVWAADPAREWDGSRLVVGGQSAGGAIAAACARQALEAGGPVIALQVLHFPPLDLVTPGDQKHAAGPSIITVPMTRLFDTAYAPDAGSKRHRLASPAWGANADGIEGIAPALVISCALDRLHDEDVRYADRLRDGGALVEHIDLPGADHGYTVRGGTRELVSDVYARIARHVVEAVA